MLRIGLRSWLSWPGSSIGHCSHKAGAVMDPGFEAACRLVLGAWLLERRKTYVCAMKLCKSAECKACKAERGQAMIGGPNPALYFCPWAFWSLH